MLHARRGWMDSAIRNHFTLRKRPGTHCLGWVDLRASLDVYGRFRTPQGFQLWTIQLAASHFTNYTNTQNMQLSFVTNSYALGYKSFSKGWRISFWNSYNFSTHIAHFSTNYFGNKVVYEDSDLLDYDTVSLGM